MTDAPATAANGKRSTGFAAAAMLLAASAVLSRLLPPGHLITVEIVPVLAERAKALLQTLGYDNITVELAGETLGTPRHGPPRGPFDAIIVTAAAPNLPPSIPSQLAMGGRMVIPIGSLDNQELIQARRTEEGLSIRWLENCRFVPLIGRDGFLGVEQAGAGAPKLDLDLLDSDPHTVR